MLVEVERGPAGDREPQRTRPAPKERTLDATKASFPLAGRLPAVKAVDVAVGRARVGESTLVVIRRPVAGELMADAVDQSRKLADLLR